MGIEITDKPEMYVVNVGDEISESTLDALNAAAAQNPAAGNAFLTVNTASSTYLTQANASSTYLTQSAAGTTYAGLASANTFTGTQAYNINSSGAAFRISQAGTGEAFRVEDQTTPDTTPFVITADGRVGIGTTTVGTNALAVAGNISCTGSITVTGGVSTTAINTFTVPSGQSYVPLTIQNNGTGNSFVVNDVASDTTPFVINNDGSVGIKRSAPSYDLDVNGTVNLNTLRFSDGTTQTTAPVAGYNPSTDIQNALSGAASPSASNVFATMADISGGGGGELNSVDPLGAYVTKSYQGLLFHGNNGGDPTVYPYTGNRIGFQYGAIYAENSNTGGYFSFDTTYLYWYNTYSSTPTIFAPTGISSDSSFTLPINTYRYDNWGQTHQTTTYSSYNGMNYNYGGSYVAKANNDSYSFTGSVAIGVDSYGRFGTTYYKTTTNFDGGNTYENTVTDFTAVSDSMTISQTHYIRIRINGQDYKIPAQVII